MRPLCAKVMTIGVLCVIALVSVAARAMAQTATDKWEVVFGVTSTPRDGATFRSGAWGGDRASVGETVGATAFSDRNGGDLGQGYRLTRDFMLEKRFSHAWDAEMRVEAATLDSVTIRLVWSRHDLLNGEIVRRAGDERTVTLRSDERHIVEILTMPPESRYANIVVELKAHVATPPDRASQPVEYDAWLFYERPDGTQVNRRVTALGATDWATHTAFEPFDLPIEVAPEKATKNLLALAAFFKGSLLGRLRVDGSLVVAVTMRADLMLAGRGVYGSQLERVYDCRLGETTRIDLDLRAWGRSTQPLPAGARPPARLVQGASVLEDGRVRIEYAPFFANHKAWMLVTARAR